MRDQRPLEPYHLVWLSVHPERSEEWLLRMLVEGFHVHHIDGDHANNDSLNLVLIESGDHMMLHNGKKRLLFKPKAPPKADKPSRFAGRTPMKQLRKELADKNAALHECHILGNTYFLELP